ncbi:MAG: hypothetical protein V3T42_01870 [Nitrospirales bacterium]
MSTTTGGERRWQTRRLREGMFFQQSQYIEWGSNDHAADGLFQQTA